MLLGCGCSGLRELPLADQAALCERFGFKVLEFAIGLVFRGSLQLGSLPAEPSPSQIRDFHALLRRHHLAAPYCRLVNDFMLPDPAAHQAMLERTLRSLAYAARCGATHVRLFAGSTPWERMDEPTWARLLGALTRCQRLAGDIGLTLCIETHGAIRYADGLAYHTHTATSHPDGLRRLLRELPPEVGFNWDPANCKAADPADRDCKLELLQGRIGYVHLHDWKPGQGGGWHSAAAGDHDLDYAALLPRLRFRGVMLVEYEELTDFEDGLRRSLVYLFKAGARMATLEDLARV
jgi:sugar phosphate isomerase/epimerase